MTVATSKNLLRDVWTTGIPNVFAIAHPFPGSPYLPLTGGGTIHMPLEQYLKDLERDCEKQQGDYFAWVWDYHESGDEADMFYLKTWQVCPPTDGVYEAVVILYYAPTDEAATIAKHMPD